MFRISRTRVGFLPDERCSELGGSEGDCVRFCAISWRGPPVHESVESPFSCTPYRPRCRTSGPSAASSRPVESLFRIRSCGVCIGVRRAIKGHFPFSWDSPQRETLLRWPSNYGTADRLWHRHGELPDEGAIRACSALLLRMPGEPAQLDPALRFRLGGDRKFTGGAKVGDSGETF